MDIVNNINNIKKHNSPQSTQLNIPPFETLPITLATVIFKLNTDVDKLIAYYLLPVTKIITDEGTKCTKGRLPFCHIPGSIISIGGKDPKTKEELPVRGLEKEKKSRSKTKGESESFRNSITIDISTHEKNINLKLSRESIQLCGATSQQNGAEAANYIIQYLKKTQPYLDYIRENSDIYNSMIPWIIENLRGDRVLRIQTKNIKLSHKLFVQKVFASLDYMLNHTLDTNGEVGTEEYNTTMIYRTAGYEEYPTVRNVKYNISESNRQHSSTNTVNTTSSRDSMTPESISGRTIDHEFENNFSHVPDNIDISDDDSCNSEDTNSDIELIPNYRRRFFHKPHLSKDQITPEDLYEWIMSVTSDLTHVSDLKKKLDLIPKLGNVCEHNLDVTESKVAMINYNYNLGFVIDRIKLAEEIDGKYGFLSSFDNASDIPQVKVELPYTPIPGQHITGKNKKKTNHTFTIHKSGSVTQSGPGGDIMKDAYYLFMKVIGEIRDEIEYDKNKPGIAKFLCWEELNKYMEWN